MIMKVAELTKTSKAPLTAQEKRDMVLVQEAIDNNDYKPFKPKEQTIRNAVEIALSRANKS